jgi:hypothetical protein
MVSEARRKLISGKPTSLRPGNIRSVAPTPRNPSWWVRSGSKRKARG